MSDRVIVIVGFVRALVVTLGMVVVTYARRDLVAPLALGFQETVTARVFECLPGHLSLQRCDLRSRLQWVKIATEGALWSLLPSSTAGPSSGDPSVFASEPALQMAPVEQPVRSTAVHSIRLAKSAQVGALG